MNSDVKFFINNLLELLGKKFKKELFLCSFIVFTVEDNFCLNTCVYLKSGRKEYMYFNFGFKEKFFYLFPYKKRIIIKLF